MPLESDYNHQTELPVEFVEDLLDKLERREERLLSWGVVDAAFSTEEVMQEVAALMNKHDLTGDPFQIADRMVQLGVLFPATDTSFEGWRTRSAETVRLIAKLRQLFPKAGDMTGGWAQARSLVETFRFQRRPRMYPRRDIDAKTFLTENSAWIGRGTSDALEVLLNGGRLRMAGFQCRAITSVLSGLRSEQTRGVIITAGTGSGKTLAFYAPAFAHIAEICDHNSWTKCLAIYPRKELLRDQFREVYQFARLLDQLMLGKTNRKLRIGAYYGDTPYSLRTVQKWWESAAAGYMCPYMRCPECDDALVWKKADCDRGIHRLECVACHLVVDDSTVLLTREQMSISPPDVLFTTTEMLNQRMADTAHGHIFGLNTRQRPTLVLLDEVHTYEGTSGAQVAMLLRRWHSRIARPVLFTGLSATLRDAQTFFAQLTGVPVSRVATIEPRADELVREGAEYQLAVRSNPTSGASVLSTTIQTAMVLARCLDRRAVDHDTPFKLFGNRIFLFTDALDVTNRLFFDLRDAEGTDSWGRPSKSSLAVLRNPIHDGARQRRRAGQSWDLPIALGHGLNPNDRIIVGRTSSQDAGIDEKSDVIVATASLEVGFNDPHVGAVIQHKSPRGAAAFLQRKGRAGRTRGMRPWTVVVLSDYGRDRETYMSHDTLFDPELPLRNLPTANQYVLRMHAVQCFIEWAALRLQLSPKSSFWRELSTAPNAPTFNATTQMVHDAVGDLLTRLLSDPSLQANLNEFIRHSLQISVETAEQLVWLPPRSVLMEALPTLLRRLNTGWQTTSAAGVSAGTDRVTPNVPLPDFISGQLFSPLTLPDVVVSIPPQTRKEEETFESMPVLQALREFAPGRVSRRYGINNTYNRHWIPVSIDGDDSPPTICIEDWYEYQQLEGRDDSIKDSVLLVRPHRIHTEKVPAKIGDSSNSFPIWTAEFSVVGEGVQIKLPAGRWQNAIRLQAFLHSNRAHVIVTRQMGKVEGELRLTRGPAHRYEAAFVLRDQRPVGLGVRLNSDCLQIDVSIPDLTWVKGALDPSLRRSLKSFQLQWTILNDRVLVDRLSAFKRIWLYELIVCALAEAALERPASNSLDLLSLELSSTLLRVRSIVVPSSNQDDPDEPPSEDEAVALLTDPAIIERLTSILTAIQNAPDDDWIETLRQRFLTGVGGAVVSALRRVCFEFSSDEITLDVEASTGKLWVTETSVGGAGFLETAIKRISEDPWQFLRLLDTAVQPSDAEIVNRALEKVLDHLVAGDLTEVAVAVRTAQGNEEAHLALQSFVQALRQVGIVTSHSVVAALAGRILRPGTSEMSDATLRSLLDRWADVEQILDMEVGIRPFAYAASTRNDLDSLVDTTAYLQGDKRNWRFDVLQTMLWERGWQSRSRGLEDYSLYQKRVAPDRDLLIACLPDNLQTLDAQEPEWFQNAQREISLHGRVAIGAADGARLASVVAQFTLASVNRGFLQFYPIVTAVATDVRGLTAQFALREVVV